ncbi:hypothetical protein [Sinorhizobium meliloti]|nr:hypothetical protein [Sinorhizobium meliloti]WKL26821.1 hypothetical protein Q1M63_21160 [Sinorhizobium meliloti]WKL41708.1 hypothetical protein Q1M64_19665 [Sinorhizobium meliloti]WQO82774.1 hypothetical protein U8C44_20280 [Sinorhizobium meliloti]WQP28025.1 hypothetical protein U8C43_18995 [Sinorhizobium meliloti]
MKQRESGRKATHAAARMLVAELTRDLLLPVASAARASGGRTQNLERW